MAHGEAWARGNCGPADVVRGAGDGVRASPGSYLGDIRIHYRGFLSLRNKKSAQAIGQVWRTDRLLWGCVKILSPEVSVSQGLMWAGPMST